MTRAPRPGRHGPTAPRARDTATEGRLWTEAERLTGVSLSAVTVRS